MTTAGWYDEGESGPPTMEDDAWYTHAVVSLGYPKVKRGDVPMEGQTSLTEHLDGECWCGKAHVIISRTETTRKRRPGE